MTASTEKSPQLSLLNRLRLFWRKNLRAIWRDFQWPVVGGLVLTALVLGFIGFRKHFVLIGETRSLWDYFYLSVQLFTLESGSIVPPIPLELQIARLLAPGVAAYAAVRALLAIFHEQLQLLRVRFMKNHVVICGLGQRGLWLAREFYEHGYRVVVIEQDEENPFIEQCREQGAIVLVGNATDKSLLHKAGVHKAQYLVAVCADDGVNAEVAVHAHELVHHYRNYLLTAFIHIVDVELCNLLREKEITAAQTDSFRLEFFNVLESGARVMLNEYPPFDGEVRDRQPHIVVVGLGKMGRSLVVEAARRWWVKYSKTNKRLRITAIDTAAEVKMEVLRLRYPQMEKVCDLVVRQMEKNAPEFERGDFLFDSKGSCDVDAIYLCFDDDVHVLADALILHQRTRQHKVPIVMRMTQDAGLATLMRGEDRSGYGFEDLHAFGTLDRTCKLESLLGGTHEILARAIHKNYVRHQREAGKTSQTNPSMVDWDVLPEDLKESNRRQADHIGVKLKAVGCGIAPLTDWEAESFKFLPEEIERLAEMEHERWCEERRLEGWSYAPGPKDIDKKTSPYLVSWEELSEEIKEYDRNTVRGLPSFLAQAGFQIYHVDKE